MIPDAFAIWDNHRRDYYINGDGMVQTYPTEEDAEEGLIKVRKTAADKEVASPVIARYLSGDEAVVIMQYPNGKYYNRYGYDEQKDTANTTAGGFDTFDEAEKALYSHRPKAEKAVEPTQSQDRGLLPAQDEIVSKVQQIEEIDWKTHFIRTNDFQYSKISDSLTSLGDLIKILLACVSIVSAAILTLILTLRIRGRIPEAGIIAASVVLASWTVFRLKPRDILSKMS